nr:MAG TPA: hypothetical protein [Bacteriophage sp.]
MIFCHGNHCPLYVLTYMPIKPFSKYGMHIEKPFARAIYVES